MNPLTTEHASTKMFASPIRGTCEYEPVRKFTGQNMFPGPVTNNDLQRHTYKPQQAISSAAAANNGYRVSFTMFGC